MKLAGYRCANSLCRGKRGLEVHHLTYDRLGEELDSDLAVLCTQCHADHHIQTERETPLGIFLKIGSELLRAMPFALVSDLADAMKTRCAETRVRYDKHQVDRALHLLLASNRLKAPKAADTCVAPDPAAPVMSHEEAIAFLRRLSGGQHLAVLRDIPDARPLTHGGLFQRDRLKAAQFVAKEIADSIARCEALETTVDQAAQKGAQSA